MDKKVAKNTVVAITGHESDAKDVSNSFVDFSIHFAIMTDSDNVLKVQDRLIKDIDNLLRVKYSLND